MKKRLDMRKIAAQLGAERRGRVQAGGGYFSALELAAEVSRRFRVPEGGGRATNPNWTERRLVGLSPRTLERLRELSRRIGKRQRVKLQPLQLAALVLERAVKELSDRELEELLEG